MPTDQPPVIPPLRLATLADGVFAIVMTLLVFQFAIPAAEEVTTGELGSAVADMWPDFAMYALSFLVLGVFWLVHHMIFEGIERYDPTLAWLNIAFLMFVALIPFSTALAVEHGPETVTALVYGINLLVIFDLAWATFAYATTDHRLVAPDYDRAIIRGGRRMGRAYTAYLLVPLAVAFVLPEASFVLYGVFVIGFISLTLIGRTETAVLWPSRTNPQ